MKDNNRRFTFLVALLIVSIALIAGTTYALFTKSVATSKVLSMRSGTKYIGIYGNNKENILLNTTYNFSIENRGVENASYNLYLDDISNSIGKSNVIYTYSKNGVSKTGTLADEIIDSANLKVGESVTITISLTSTVPGTYQGRIRVETKNATEDISGINKPVLAGDMIPVVYDSTQSSWVKADKDGSWYNYDNGEWANAVTISDASNRARYINSEAGTKIDINDINTMWVWIPRYSYTLGNTNGTKVDGSFDIKFIDKTVTDTGSGAYTGEVANNFYTPSSFCFGDTCDTNRADTNNIELPGIWVSKFELTGTTNNPTSIPNANSLRNNTISSLFTTIASNLNGESGQSKYGLSGQYDTHMIKNTEWGAIAYLSQSKYGKYGNLTYTDNNKEIYINNYYDEGNKSTLTGCSAGTPSSLASNSCTYTYDSLSGGVGASTTGNIYGIYDTVGGSYEFVMANYNNLPLESGLTSMPGNRYYNLYTGTTGIKGDATNSDGTSFINDTNSWFVRSSLYNSGQNASSGIFNFTNHTGRADENIGTRMCLVTW